MAHNTTLNAGSGGDVVRTNDTTAGYKVPIQQLATGVLGAAETLVSPTNPLPVGVAPLGTPKSKSATGAASALAPEIAAAVGKTNYLAGIAVTGLGATSAGSIQVTTTGLTDNLAFTLPIPAGATTGVVPLIVPIDPPIPASGANVAIVLNVPSFGTGNTAASASLWGFQV